MGKEKDKMCPYLESSHSEAVLHYVCEAVGESGVRIKSKDLNSFACFTAEHRKCKRYKECKEK